MLHDTAHRSQTEPHKIIQNVYVYGEYDRPCNYFNVERALIMCKGGFPGLLVRLKAA